MGQIEDDPIGAAMTNRTITSQGPNNRWQFETFRSTVVLITARPLIVGGTKCGDGFRYFDVAPDLKSGANASRIVRRSCRVARKH